MISYKKRTLLLKHLGLVTLSKALLHFIGLNSTLFTPKKLTLSCLAPWATLGSIYTI